MNRYLITGIAALAMCIGFTSCSHDITPITQEEMDEANAKQIVAQYNKAFIATFGQPASNQDWGFGNNNASARAFTRAIQQPSIPFPDDCDPSKFLKEVPEGVNKLPPSGGGPGTYYIDSSTESVSTWSGASTIYVTGTVDLSSGDTDAQHPRFAPDLNSEIYLVKGATLKLGKVSAELFNVAAIYIAEEATLETAGLLKANTNTAVYNHGTVKAGIFEVNTSSFLYNVGTLEAESVNAESNPSYIVNDGVISCSTVVVNAGAVQNNAGWTVSGTTKINSNNSGWVNNGQWKTYDYLYIGGSENVINNCFLWVTNNFDMNISSEVGAFKIDAGGGVLAANFYGGRDVTKDPISLAGPYKIIMGENAVFKVTGTATLMGGRGAMYPGEEGFGFFGPNEGGYAVFQAKEIVRNTSLTTSWGYVTYGGNLYVSAETHFKQGDDGYRPHAFIFAFGDNFSIENNIYAEGFNRGKPSITIPESPCNPGFEGDEDDFDVRIIGEDLTPGETDWDFNDVVFGVQYNDYGTGALCTLLAAGGTLPLRIAKKGDSDISKADEWVEVHALFGVPVTTMVNTGGISTTINDKPTFEVTGIDKANNGKDIKIYVNKGTDAQPNWIELKAEKGDPAAKLAVKKGFKVCTERQNINEVYVRFKDWVANPLIKWY